MTVATPASGSAMRQGPPWSARARDWAENERQQAPTYEAAIRAIGLRRGDRVLELGCGSGVFLRAARDRGAHVTGLDASEALIELARARVPDADLVVGDMQFLPYEDDRFDAIASFNSIFFAADMTETLREVRRVARPGAAVVIQVWGRPDRCDLTAMKRALAPLQPGPRAAAPALWEPGVLEGLVGEAGLTPEWAFDVTWAYDYADAEALARGLMSPAPVDGAIRAAGEGAVRTAIVDALAPYRTPAGGYRLENEWHFLVARA
jgi:SAM-dependent methyltransferase